MPKGYFDAAATNLLTDFREVVLSDRPEELMEGFPEVALVDRLQNTWHSSATSIYRNWLHYLVTKRTDISAFPAMAAVYHQPSRKRPALP